MNELDLYSQPNYSDNVKLYHVSDDPNERLLKFKFRDKPTDTPLFFHHLINLLSKKKFDIPIRSLFFTYTDALGSKSLRVIPLGNKVKFFYHPTVGDLTALIVQDMIPQLEELVTDIVDQYDFNLDAEKISDSIYEFFETNTSLTKIKEQITDQFREVSDDPNKFSDRILRFIVDYFKVYVADVVEVNYVEDIPPDTESEIMIYAPDDIYLQSRK